MRRFCMMLCVCSALAFVMAPMGTVFAQAEAAEPAVEVDAEMVEAGAQLLGMSYDELVAALTLTEEQQGQIKVKLAAFGKASSEWHAANDEKLAAFKATGKQARKDGDKDASRTALQAGKALRAEGAALLEPLKQAAVGVLTAEQKAKWVATQIQVLVMVRKWQKLDLTEKQSADILALCQAAATADPDLDLSNRKASRAVVKTITATATENILTEEQRAKVAKKGGRR